DAFHYSIQFTGGLANANLQDLGAANVALTGTSPSVTATKIRDGAGNEVQTVTLGGTSGGTFSPLFGGAAIPTNNEVQLLTFVAATVNAATFTLGMNVTSGGTITTAAITYSTTAATTVTNIQNALNTTFGAGLFTVASIDVLNYVIAATGGFANANLPQF